MPFEGMTNLPASYDVAFKVSSHIADALEQPFQDGQFDLVWSIENGEQMHVTRPRSDAHRIISINIETTRCTLAGWTIELKASTNSTTMVSNNLGYLEKCRVR
ncbi:hypothetical protein MKW98_023353 [Papaver atlanticum]|uniref:Uncharacterized protein n=1 Tax=Papaver atlanticum TaxID=357466 RepID=A0AAD4SYM5_9MAGN|nr:hypothetical protein MKW98_023353 [Papaver atlanticum]